MEKLGGQAMHTAEHILNQTMIRLFGTGRCFSAHIEKRKSKCDYHFDRDLTREEGVRLAFNMNELIKTDLPVTEANISIEEAREKYSTERLPAGTSGPIRIIHVGDYDAVPCIGQHVKSTKELGIFELVSHSFADGVLRVRYRLK
jgi:misacylated tRNA(Ala) deacylase